MTSEEEGIRLIRAGYSDQLTQQVVACSTWIFWYRPVGPSRHVIVNNGTVFFLDAGRGAFGFTASHVIESLREAKERYWGLGVQVGNLPIDPTERLLGNDTGRDVATFRIDADEIARLDKRAHDAPRWPPSLPQEERGAFFGGYRRGTGAGEVISPTEHLPWDFSYGFGPITLVLDHQSTMRFNREEWVSRAEHPAPAPGASWGGTSGGPMFSLFENPVVYFQLAGVISEYRADRELMVFAPLGRIHADGSIRP